MFTWYKRVQCGLFSECSQLVLLNLHCWRSQCRFFRAWWIFERAPFRCVGLSCSFSWHVKQWDSCSRGPGCGRLVRVSFSDGRLREGVVSFVQRVFGGGQRCEDLNNCVCEKLKFPGWLLRAYPACMLTWLLRTTYIDVFFGRRYVCEGSGRGSLLKSQ